jgi:hypothetical protein
MMTITRREAVIRLAVAMGAGVVGPRLLAADFRVSASAGNTNFSADELALLDEIGDTIIPATDTPGAKAVGIGAFIAMMVRDCYPPRDQGEFKAGLGQIEARFSALYRKSFREGAPADRTKFLNALDEEQKAFTKANRVEPHTDGSETPDAPQHYFRMMKELTVLGYFTSEIGASKALRFIEVPGSFNGAAPYKKGDRAWFS